jgi:hypothetical protein
VTNEGQSYQVEAGTDCLALGDGYVGKTKRRSPITFIFVAQPLWACAELNGEQMSAAGPELTALAQ